MASPIVKFADSVCVQKAIHWKILSDDGQGGFIVDDNSPVEIDVRWDDSVVIRRESGRDIGRGDEGISDASVLIRSNVDEILVGDYLMLIEFSSDGSKLKSVSDLSQDELVNPRLVEDARRIMTVEKTPLFRSRTEFIRRVYLEPKV